MAPQEHNKIIGIMHLIWGGFNALMMLIMIPFMLFIFLPLMRSDPNAPPELLTFFGAILGLVIVLSLLMSLPPILAGYAMLKRKRWAKVMSIVAACFEALSMPFGTALCVYTLWFHFGPGKGLHGGGYDAPPAPDWRGGSLREGSAYDWEAQRAQQPGRAREYTPPRQPPDWRG